MTSLLGDCTYAGNDPDGLSLCTGHRKVRAEYEHREAQISVHDNLTITAASGGATRRIENRSREMRLVALTGTMAQFAAQFIEALREISLAQGYQGQWQVGVHLNHLRGAAGYEDFSSGSAPEFPQDSCTHHVVIQPTAWDAPQTQIEAVAVELLAKYLRGLGRSEWSFNRLLQQV